MEKVLEQPNKGINPNNMQKTFTHNNKVILIDAVTSEGNGLCCLRGSVDGKLIQQLNNIETANIGTTVTGMETHLKDVADNGQNIPQTGTDVGDALAAAGLT